MTPHDQHTSAEELTDGLRWAEAFLELHAQETGDDIGAVAQEGGKVTEVDQARHRRAVLMVEAVRAARRTMERQGEGLGAASAEAARLFPDEVTFDYEPPSGVPKHSLGRIVVDHGPLRFAFVRGAQFAARRPTPNSADGAENGREG